MAGAAVGLIVYGATSEEDLQGVADNKEDFKRQFNSEGVPKAICDLLFAKYVAKDGDGKKRASSGATVSNGEATRQKILDRTNPVGVGHQAQLSHATSCK